jgi:cation transport ATPase
LLIGWPSGGVRPVQAPAWGRDHQLDFWWELALLIVIMLLPLDRDALALAPRALDSLAAPLPDEAERVEGNQIVTVAPSDLRVGDVVIVRPGGSVPADGEIIDGAADMNESMVTGESVPVRRGVGERVVAGTVATDSGLRVKVSAVGDDTALAGIQRLVTEAQNSSSRAQRLADIAAGWLFWFALGAAIITAVIWGIIGRPEWRHPDHHRAGDRVPARAGLGYRWWSPLPPNARPAAVCWSRTGSRWRACGRSARCSSTRPAP